VLLVAALGGFTGGVDGYAAGVLRSLMAVRDLFGAPASTSLSVTSSEAPRALTPWAGAAAERERANAAKLSQTHGRFTGADRGVDAWAQRTAADTAAARGSASSLVASASSAANALAPYSATPAGRAALMSSMSDHASQGQRLVTEYGATLPGRRAELASLTAQYGLPESSGQTRPLSVGGRDVPLSPSDDEEDPPHGKDRRYWMDVTKIVRVPEGELGPAGYMQVGPEMWYPRGNPYVVSPPPDPAQYPLDIADVVVVEEGGLFPPRYQEIGPNIGAPDPDGYVPSRPWGAPQKPVDVRDIIEVLPGELAPSNYIEYFPGWWVPDYSAR